MLLAKTRSRPRARKPGADRLIDKAHTARLHGLPSIVSGQTADIVAHHLRTSRSSACGGRKSGDDEAVPITHAEHVELHHHPGGEDAWWASKGIDPHPIAARLYLETHGGEMP